MPYDVSHITLGKVSGLDGSTLIETNLEGSVKVHPNYVPPTAADGFRTKYSNRQGEWILARNTSGATIPGGRLVGWAAGYRKERFDRMTYVAGGEAGGVVDPLLGTRGVLANELCWVQTKGLAEVATPTTTAAFGGSIVEGEPLYCLGASGATNSVAGRVTRFGNRKIFAQIAESSEHENTITAADFDQSITLPPYGVNVGDIIKIRAQATVIDNKLTDTLPLLLRCGGITLATTGAVDVADGDIGYFDAQLVVRAVGAAATAAFQACGVQALGVPGTVTAKPFFKNEATSFDTTAAMKVAVNADWSVAHADNEVSLSFLTVEIERGAESQSIGRAAEAKADTAVSDTVLVDLDLQSP